MKPIVQERGERRKIVIYIGGILGANDGGDFLEESIDINASRSSYVTV